MGARADLMEVAGALATAAKTCAQAARPGDEDTVTPQFRSALMGQAGEYATSAKHALQAASLVDADPAPIVAALERLDARLHMGTGDVLDHGGPAAVVDQVTELLEHYEREVAIGAAVQSGYVALRGLLANLLRDFEAGDSETSRRIAARIQQGLEFAAEAVELAKGQEAPHG